MSEWFRMHWVLAIDSFWVVATALMALGLAFAGFGQWKPLVFIGFGLVCFLMGHLRGSIAMDEVAAQLERE